jgi:REP element-mobilizing transposase RayT
MLRGIGGQNIFQEDEDCEKFIEVLYSYKKTIGYEIYAYCLMGNHIHLLIKQGKEDLSNTMKRIGASYVYWYNWQYGRKGHLFQDRYKSEAVEDDAYLLTVIRYIHQNPVRAGLVEEIGAYKWSSYKEYMEKERLVSTDFVLGIFNKDREKAIQSFIEFNREMKEEKCLEITEERKTISDKDVRKTVEAKYKMEIAELQKQEPMIQTEVLRFLKELEGVSLRQLSRITGFTVNRIFRA